MANAVENLEKLERRLIITVPVADITAEVEKRLKVRARTAKAPGFRQGKVPAKMVAQMYGASTHADVINDMVNAQFRQAIQENKLDIAGRPKFEEKTGDDVAKDVIAFNATFEVYPEVVIGDLGNVEIEKAVATVTDAEVDTTIKMLRKRQATYSSKADDAVAEDSDRATIDFVGTIDGEEFDGGKAENFKMEVGANHMLPEFEAAVKGMKVGETKKFPLSFPENYQGEDVAGKTAEFTVTVKSLEAAQLPEVDETFAKNMGIEDGDVAKMRADIQKNLAREVKNRITATNKQRVMNALVEACQFDVPKALVMEEVAELKEITRRDIATRNPERKDIELPEAMFVPQAERRVRLGLLLGELMKDETLAVTDEKLRARAEEIASSYQDPQMVIDYYLNDKTRRRELESIVMEENAVDYVLGKAKITEKVVPFEELMAQQM